MTTNITVQVTITSTLEKAWEAFTNPDQIIKWNYASDDWHCPSVINDLRTGGLYKARMEAKDGSFGFDFEAIYDEIIMHQKIVYTMADGRKATTDFKEIDAQNCSVTTTFDAEKINPIEMQQQGWQAILNNFKKYVEAS